MSPEEAEGNRQAFFTPELFAREQARRAESTRGRLLIAGCRSGSLLSRKAVARYRDLLRAAGSQDELLHLEDIDGRFSDTETTVRLDLHVSGYDVFLFQALLDPTSELTIDQNYVAFLVAARTFREHGANHVTAVLPYLAYGRQDKPTKYKREPVTAKLMADMSVVAGIDRLVCWDPHCGQVRGFYSGMPANMLEPITMFIGQYHRFQGRSDVIVVAPDVGASKFVTHFGRALNLKCAIASKYRPEPEISEVTEMIGDFEGKTTALVLDDMISGGGTIHAVVEKIVHEKGIHEVYVGVSHNLCLPGARDRLVDLHENYGLCEVVVTDSIPQTAEFTSLPFLRVQCLADTLARTINRIHYNRSVSEVFWRPH